MNDEHEALSLHLAGSWWIWRDMAVRGAGFAVDDLLRLGHPKLAADADRDTSADGDAWCDGGLFRADYQAAVEDSCTVLGQIADSAPFRSAMLWQNRKLVDEALDPYLAKRVTGGARNSRQRQRENVLMKYVQRYHAKNESIGFFGAVGWARWADGASSPVPAMAVTGFHSDIVDRRAQVEDWAVRALAERFSADPQTRLWLKPVLAPNIKVRDGRVHTALRGWFDMPRPRFDVLTACDGQSTVTEIVERLIACGVPGIASTEDVLRHLTSLERAGYVAGGIQVPPTLHADRYLRRELSRIPDAALRERHSAVVDGIQAAADRVRDAAGDHCRLANAFVDLESRFMDASGADPHRSRPDPHRTGVGHQVVGRALMVEDCRSALSATLQPSLLDDLAGPLDLVLASSRWLVDRVGERYQQILGDIYDGMARPGRPGVGVAAILSEFWPRCASDVLATEAAASVAELQGRWSDILQVPAGVRKHQVAAADIAASVHQQFAAPTAPWLSGRIHCPDVMIAATDVESIARGDYAWVLGEMHPATNTLNQGVFVLSHPDPDRMRAMADEEAGRGAWLIPVYPSDWPEISSRAYPPPYLISPGLDYVHMSAEPPREGMTGTAIPLSALTVVRDDRGSLWIEHDDGRRWHPLALLGEFLTDGLPDTFQPFAPAPYRPRVSIDRFVLAREQWRVPGDELAWPTTANEADRYREVRRWARGLGLPRHVFIRVVGERKPFYVDLTSPLMLNMIASTLRTAGRERAGSAVTITEMYPGPDELWVPHSAGGRRSTSELRMVLVDRAEE